MKIETLLSRARTRARGASLGRYLVLALPLFALSTTLHAGCNTGPNGLYYNTYGNNGNRIPSVAATSECVVYRNGSNPDDPRFGGYFAPCDDDEGDGYADAPPP
jgi:hypothetical protein